MVNDFSQAMKSMNNVTSTLSRRWIDGRVKAVQSYTRILADYSSGNADVSKTASALAKFVVEEGTRYSADSYQLAVDYATELSKQSSASPEPMPDPSGNRNKIVHDIMLAGKIGSEATGDFLLENPHSQDVAISFAASNYTGSAGDIKAAPECDPAVFDLKAGEEKKVFIRTKIDGRKFAANNSYAANVAVCGFDDMILRVHLSVSN